MARKCRKLKNGQYTCVVYIGKDPKTGKNITQRVTGSSLPETRKLADRIALDAKEQQYCKDTLSESIDEFMQLQKPMVSPNTYRDYWKYKRKLISVFPFFCSKRIDKIRQEDVQAVLNALRLEHIVPQKKGEEIVHKKVKGLASKTIRNYYGFIVRVLRFKKIEIDHPTLPEKTRPNIYVPTDAEIRTLLREVADTDIEIPVLLGAFGPLREGEISALEPDDIIGNIAHVHANKVYVSGEGWLLKETPKSYAGNRMIELPPFLVDKIGGGKPTDLTPRQIYYRFKKALKAADLPDFRFHDLRHYCASTMHAQGIPDAYIMQRGGWSTDATLKAVYRHTMADQDKAMTEKALAHFQSLV